MPFFGFQPVALGSSLSIDVPNLVPHVVTGYGLPSASYGYHSYGMSYGVSMYGEASSYGGYGYGYP